MARLIKRRPDTGTASLPSAKYHSNSTRLMIRADNALKKATREQLRLGEHTYCDFFVDNNSHDYTKISKSHEEDLERIHNLVHLWKEINIRVLNNAESLRNDYMCRLTNIDVPKLKVVDIFGPVDGERKLGGKRFPDILLAGAPQLKKAYLHGCGFYSGKTTYASLQKLVITGVHLNLSELYRLPISAPRLHHLVLSRLDDPDCGENLPSSLNFKHLHRLGIYHGKGSTAFLSLLCAPLLTKLQVQNVPLFSASDLKGYAEVLRENETGLLKFPSLRTLWFGIQDDSRGFADEDMNKCWQEFAGILRRFPILQTLAFVGSNLNCCTEYINRFRLDTSRLLLKDLAVIRLNDRKIKQSDRKIEQSDDYLRATLRFLSKRQELDSPLKTVEFAAEDWNAEDWAKEFPLLRLRSMETVRWEKPRAKISENNWKPDKWTWVWTRSR